jgi:hypothetical protein
MIGGSLPSSSCIPWHSIFRHFVMHIIGLEHVEVQANMGDLATVWIEKLLYEIYIPYE